MQVLFSRASCRCTSCGQAARAVARHTTTAVPRRRVGAGDLFTACYSTLLASAAIADAEVKRERRKEWDRVIEEARSGNLTSGVDEGEQRLGSDLDLESEQTTYSKLSARSSSTFLEHATSPVFTRRPIHIFDGSNAPTMETPLQGKLRALDLRIKQSLNISTMESNSNLVAETEAHYTAVVEEWAEENPIPGMSFREPQSRLHLDKREASIARLVMRLLGEISIFSSQNPTGAVELSSETKLVLEAIEGLHTSFSKFPNYSWEGHHVVSTTRSKLHRSLYKICQRTTPRKSEVDSMIAKICYNLLISTAPPNIITYNIMIGELGRLKQHKLADMVINSYFCDSRFSPTMETIQLMLDHYISTCDRRGFHLMLDRLRATGPGGKPSPGEPISNMRIGMRSIKLLYLDEIQSWAAHPAVIHRNGQLIRKSPRNSGVFETIIKGCLEMKELRRAVRYLKAGLREGQKIHSKWIFATALACVKHIDIRAGQSLLRGILSSWRDEQGSLLMEFPRYVRYAIYQLVGLCGVSVTTATSNSKQFHHIWPGLLQDLLLHLEIASITEKLNESAEWIVRLQYALGLNPRLNLNTGMPQRPMEVLESPLTRGEKLRRDLITSQLDVLRSQVKFIEYKVINSESRLAQAQKNIVSWTYGILTVPSRKSYDAYASTSLDWSLAKKLEFLLLLVREDQQKAVGNEALEDLYIKPVTVAWAGMPNAPAYGYALAMGH